MVLTEAAKAQHPAPPEAGDGLPAASPQPLTCEQKLHCKRHTYFQLSLCGIGCTMEVEAMALPVPLSVKPSVVEVVTIAIATTRDFITSTDEFRGTPEEIMHLRHHRCCFRYYLLPYSDRRFGRLGGLVKAAFGLGHNRGAQSHSIYNKSKNLIITSLNGLLK
ncbi:uncharacterized protein BCR38DRAFT_404185 [Pseudomassariella vexata]|uniref:Uncharacterized protein n=1 Tax=Pseudomassariella vexata TaxID=1141098 RepID=A0A1Y2EIK4_9PEZI|nr:uncharacterized protein BCR38DRAFT_404185 [Pseudomassariella vexata]ORY71056.1 hypothetical protein BCR38DRAFT_404185 [Pseudomassariella vexata]